MILPDFYPKKKWEPAPKYYVPVTWTGVKFPISKLKDGRLVIDQCRMRDGSYQIVIFDNKDNPNLKHIPENAPRAVKALYHKSNQLAFLRQSYNEKMVKEAIKQWNDYVDKFKL